MTLALSRIDYTTVGVTSRGTTVVFPPNEAATKQPQKFAVADHDGILHIYGTENFNLNTIYIYCFTQNNFSLISSSR